MSPEDNPHKPVRAWNNEEETILTTPDPDADTKPNAGQPPLLIPTPPGAINPTAIPVEDMLSETRVAPEDVKSVEEITEEDPAKKVIGWERNKKKE